MTTNHTPTHCPPPWVVKGDTRIAMAEHPIFIADCNMDYRRAVQMPGESADAANAAFIVRAVNAHDELVAALRRLVEASDFLQANPGDEGCENCLAARTREARVALAKVSATDTAVTP